MSFCSCRRFCIARPPTNYLGGPVLFIIILTGVVVASVSVSASLPTTRISLDSNWTLTTEYEKITVRNQSLPIGVFSALETQATNPIYESFNDVNLRWIARRNWTFQTQFPTPVVAKDVTQVKRVVLTFFGIDTVSTVWLNGVELGHTNNMFVRYRFDVGGLLKRSDSDLNELLVEISNPIKVASDLARANNFTPPNCPPSGYNGECHMNFLRKMQASFGWDWGLAAPSLGLWKGVELEVYSMATIRDVTLQMNHSDQKWAVSFRVFLETGTGGATKAPLKGTLVVSLPAINVRVETAVNQISDDKGVVEVDVDVMVQEDLVKLWWPNGFGDQNLYKVEVSLLETKQGKGKRSLQWPWWVRQAWENPIVMDTKTLRIGFRTINLIQKPLGNGLSFYFEVNGHAIFMKGSNWIPSDILPERGVDRNRIRHLLTAARDSHMNMLRVWGGGVYESDFFYDLADELGILIWQDLMFACAMYPVTEEFLTSVRIEVEQNTRRLQHHPSIAIFATNNENEAALVQNWYGTARDVERFKEEYRALYVDVVMRVVEDNDKWRVCLSSSPSNGLKAIEDNYISVNPQDNNFGDIHYYNYMADGWNWAIYPRPRFVSEYGFQSYPAFSSWAQTLGGDDYLPELLKHRQHSPLGEVPILFLIGRHLPLEKVPEADLVPAKIYFSQIAQAMAIKTETEFYRTQRGSSANTMGALYWQLNDVWVTPSWSSIDFLGKFKILQFYAKKFLEPTTIVPILSPAGVIEVHVVNDVLPNGKAEPDSPYEIKMRMFNWGDLQSLEMERWSVNMTPNDAFQVASVPLWNFLNASVPAEEHFLQFSLIDNQGRVVSSNYLFPTSIKRARGVRNDIRPELMVASIDCDPMVGQESVTFNVRTKAPILFFYIDVLNEGVGQDYKLSDNGFMIVEPITTVTITYTNEGCSGTRLTIDDLRVYTVNEYM